jgi:hypothetical protein
MMGNRAGELELFAVKEPSGGGPRTAIFALRDRDSYMRLPRDASAAAIIDPPTLFFT